MLQNKKITSIIFDCFGVLADPVLSYWYRDNYLNLGLVDAELEATLRRFDLGELTEDDIFDRFSKYEGITATRDEIRKQTDLYMKLNKELIKVIRGLRTNGYQIVLLSNANHSFFDRKIFAEFPDFKELFDYIVISSQVKMVKPDPEIYLHTLEKVGKRPDESIFIDDNSKNVETAENLGIHGHIFKDIGSLKEYFMSLDVRV